MYFNFNNKKENRFWDILIYVYTEYVRVYRVPKRLFILIKNYYYILKLNCKSIQKNALSNPLHV